MAAAFRHGGGYGSLCSAPFGLLRVPGGVAHGASGAVSARTVAIYGEFAATVAAAAAGKAQSVTPSACDTRHLLKLSKAR